MDLALPDYAAISRVIRLSLALISDTVDDGIDLSDIGCFGINPEAMASIPDTHS